MELLSKSRADRVPVTSRDDTTDYLSSGAPPGLLSQTNDFVAAS
jgi:hypothetical protein